MWWLRWQSGGVGGVYSFCKGGSCNMCIKAIGSFFLSRTENLQHVLSFKLFIFEHYVTFQVIVECNMSPFRGIHLNLK